MPVSPTLSTAARTPSGPKQLVKQLTIRRTAGLRETVRSDAESSFIDRVERHGDLGLGIDDTEGAAAGQHVHQGLAADLPAPAAGERRAAILGAAVDLPADQVAEVGRA